MWALIVGAELPAPASSADDPPVGGAKLSEPELVSDPKVESTEGTSRFDL